MGIKASDSVTIYENKNGPVIGTVSRKVIEKDGLYYKDIDGTGEVSRVNDWHLSADERAAAYVKVLTTDEKIAQLFISDWRMGPKYPPARAEGHTAVPDESGLLDEAELEEKNMFGAQKLPGTTALIKDWFSRHIILRADPSPEDLADWMNQLQSVAEECDRFIPVEAASNSRNENGEKVFGMNDASGTLATWPGTLGIAAAVRGNGIGIIDTFADCVRREWRDCGLRKGYMYMADCVTDPRWQRTYGTFGEDPELASEIFERLVPGIQGGEEGPTPDGVALTVKHFPGGGARENGFDPHYAAGQWNVYATEGSLVKYHLPAFRAAVKHRVSSVMPYYSKPSAEKSSPQKSVNGGSVVMEPYGFAYNKFFIDEILRYEMGFEGYVNSDTGIAHNMCWGVEALDLPERIGFAVTQSGVDLISGLFDNPAGREAYDRSKNGYYDNHPVPEGFRKEDLVLTDESVDRAVTRTLTEMFRLGLFENPYADPEKARRTASLKADWDEAALCHRESVVLLKNNDTLPLTREKTEGKMIYAEAFAKNPADAEASTASLRNLMSGYDLTDDPSSADYAILMVTPTSGEYFSASAGYLELDICEGKTVNDVGNDGKPLPGTHQETTLSGAGRIADISDKVHGHGGKVIAEINFSLAWIPGNVEPYADALLAGFNTFQDAVLDAITGSFKPTGRLPITLPRNDAVIAVDKDGICVSPNDVPGYDKDKYMPESLMDENGRAYAYRDSAGNYYELDFHLSF